FRISYCTADKIHDKVFAYIAQNQLNENLECHAFLCTKRKMAQAVTLTVAQAFKIAFEFWQAAKEEKEKRERLEGEGTSSPSSEAPAHPDTPAATGNLLDLEDSARSPVTSSTNPPHLDNSMFGPSSSVNNNVVWEMDDGLDEAFSRLAQSRTNPHVLDTGLTAQDIQSAETLSPVDWNKIDSNTGEKDDLFMF
ncbi:ARH protein, partial [Probosciger aterrimus]|nr:ARH protein [Probosciger aterrimus]